MKNTPSGEIGNFPEELPENAEALRSEQVIRQRGAPAFYKTYAWVKTRARIMEAGHYECADCRAKGLYSPAEHVHHVKPLLQRPDLALSAENLVPLCEACHEKRHNPGQNLTPERW